MELIFDDSRVASLSSFKQGFIKLQEELLRAEPFDVGEWQSTKLGDNPMTHMRELFNTTMHYQIPNTIWQLKDETGAHLPWAEDHFQERVSGEPLNPPPSNEWWPFAQKSNKEHKSEGEAFSHTYPERIWPKRAGQVMSDLAENEPIRDVELGYLESQNHGIRFDYGDLNDVVNLLVNQPNTRQAFLPIWFPEDTGVVHGKRVPCTLGYHFMIRGGKLQITYYMRSCDLLRHFQDDVYMAARLGQWVREEIMGRDMDMDTSYDMGKLIMHMANLHVFEGDTAMMKYRVSRGEAWSA
jgi:thymidylate synthase